ncbi:zinc finger protein 2 homolog isoform X6 [Sparus aurata]|uniref:zinc finger protein 2 homolog isoform X6 n=1 Tax=Sparus aurata TaxID=8175 RepID=UPI0011C0CD4F|nr:zinc finger protein 2 homolog isoform X6 [Sparus aurata]
MSSVECLRGFINERLTAAAEEIFGVFQKTIVEYEEEIDRQRKLLDVVWKPEIKLHRIELPQQDVCMEDKVLADQLLCNQERNSSLDQEEPEPPQIKEEQEELCSSQEGEQLVLKQETDTSMLIPPYEESDHQLLSHNSNVAESQDQEGGKHGDSGSTTAAEPEPKKRLKGHGGKNPYKCDTCGKMFKYNCDLNLHLRVHTGEKPYLCNTCGKRFSQRSTLYSHKRLHTGWKPYHCNTCGMRFCWSSQMKRHMKIHEGENVLTSSLDQEEPEPPQIKEEQEELCSSQEGEQLALKQETDTSMLIPPYEESDHSEPELESDHSEPELGSDPQLLSHNSHVAESQDQEGGKHGDSGSTSTAEPEPEKRHWKSHCDAHTAQKGFKCGTCGAVLSISPNLLCTRGSTQVKSHSLATLVGQDSLRDQH